MSRIDAATGWSLGLWFVFGLVPTVGESVGWSVLLNHQGAAAWVQAVGSVLAIIAAVAISSQQHRRDTERRNAEKAEPIRMRAALMANAGMALANLYLLLKEHPGGSVSMYIANTRRWHEQSQRFTDFAEAILEISPNDLVHHVEIPFLSTVKDSIRRAQRDIEGALRLPTTTHRDSLKHGSETLMNSAQVFDTFADIQRNGNT